MNHRFPDWMLAAVAIGGWELFDLVARHWHIPRVRWFGAAVVAVCAVILAIRYTVRLIARFQQPRQEPDPDEWKNY